MKSTYLLVLMVLAMLATACVNTTCEEARPAPSLNIAFRKYTDATRTIRQARDTTIALLDVYAQGLEDSSFLDPDADTIRARNIRLRLSPLANETTFVLNRASTATAPIQSTITVGYDRQSAFISQACGYEVSYTNLSVTGISPDLDSAVVIVPVINPIRNEIHIQLYFRP